MKRFLSFLTLLLLLVAPRAVNATEVTTYAYDNSSVYYMKCVYDTDDGTTKIYLYGIDSYAYKKDMFFPNKVYVKFEDYDGKGGVLDVSDGGIEYELDENFSIDMIAYGDVVETLTIRCNGAIPDNFAYYMEMDSHSNPTKLRSITIGENITKIGNNAFPYHENLESIVFDGESKLTEIGDNAFTAAREEEMMMPGSYTYYGNLKWLDLPKSVTTIGSEAFAGHLALTSLIIPSTVNTIGENAFAQCGITDLTIGNGAGSMSSLTQSPFIGCPLKTVTVSADYSSEGYVASIAPYMFANVSSHFTLQFNPLYMTAYEFVGFYEKCLANSGVESILMPEGYSLSPMYPYAIFFDKSACEFTYNLSGLYIQTSSEIGNRVVVEDKAFYYSGLKSFEMSICDGMFCESTTPSTSLAKIGASAFEGSKLTGDLVLTKYINPTTKAEDFLELGENAFANTPNLTSVTFEGKTNEGMYEWLPQGIFYRSGIKSVTLPANITAIGVEAFAESKLETFTADANIEDIYQGAFKNCKELTSVDLSKSKVATLYQELFRNDSKLAELKLPEEMQYFQQYAFEGTALKSLNVNASHLDPYAIYDMPELEEVRFTHPLLMFVNENSLVSLPKLKTVDFGNYVKYLQKNFISDCPLYDSVVIGPAVTGIDKDAFAEIKDNVKSITLKSGDVNDIADISDAPFNGFKAAVYFDPSVFYVPKHLFSSMTVTNSVDVRSDLSFDDDAFESAIIDSLDWHYPEESVYPFKSAEVKKLTFSNMTDIKQSGLFQGANIRNLYLEGITDISGEYVFEGANILNEDRDYTLVIPASMKKIGKSAFRNIDTNYLLFEKGTGLTIAEKAFERPSTYYHVTSLYGKDNIPVAADDAFSFEDKVNTFFAGACDNIEAYKAAKGWKDMPVEKWDGITEYKYSFEVVGEVTKRPIEYYYYMIYVNGENPNLTYIGCDNKAKLEFYTPCAEVVFDHWEDGSTDPVNYNITLTSDTVIRIFVKETQNDAKLALERPELSDVAKIYMASTTDSENWVEQSSAKVNGCDPNIYNAKVVLSDTEHYSFIRWYNTSDGTTYSTDPEIFYLNSALDLKAEIYVNQYNVMVELDPMCWDCMSEVDHLELNGTDKGTSIYEIFDYNTELTLNFVGVTSGDTKYILDYWQDEFGAIVSEDNPYTFKVTDNYHIYPIVKLAGKYTVTAKALDDALGSVTMDFDSEAEVSKGSGIFWEKSQIELNATSKTMHSYFKQWNDGNEDNPRIVKVTKDFDYVAEFEKDSFNITVKIEGIPEELVEVKGAGRYGWDDEATLSYTLKDDHYQFENWFGETYSDKATFTFNVTKSSEVRIVFSPKNYTVTVVVNPAEGGTITGGGSVPYKSNLILTATANEGYEFVSWEDDDKAPATRTVEILGDATYQANFKLVEHTVTVKSADEKTGTVKGGGVFAHGATATIEAEPKEHYKFVRWNDDNTDNPRTVSVTADVTYTAYFAIITHDITVKADDDVKGTVKGSGTYNEGETISIEATPAEHYRFVEWQDGNTDNPRHITVLENATYTAKFEIIRHTITVKSADETKGTVSGGGEFDEGSKQQISATPAAGFKFEKWDDGNTDNPRDIIVVEDKTYIASFVAEEVVVTKYTITVESDDEKMGSVSGGGEYVENSTTEISAEANEGYHFTQWSDGNTDNPREITVTGNATYKAEFAINTYTVNVVSTDAKAGSVEGGGEFEHGATTTIKAQANEGYHFVQWSDGVKDNPRTVTVTANITYYAQFEKDAVAPEMVTISVMSEDEQMGLVYGGKTVEKGTAVSIAAVAKTGFKFVQWNDGNNDNPRSVIAENNALYIAQFAKEDAKTFKIAATSANNEQGSVEGAGEYAENAVAKLIAIAKEGYKFSMWNDGNTDNPRLVTVTKDESFVAIFEKINTEQPTFTLNVSVNNDAMGTATGSGKYQQGAIATLVALANPGFRFIGWNDDVKDNPRYINVTADANYIANFEKIPDIEKTFVVTLISNDEKMGTVVGSGTYKENAEATLVALPNPGYKFVRWSDTNTDNPRVITVTEDLTLFAIFEKENTEKQQFTITISSADESKGEVIGAGEFTLDEGTVLVITAKAKVGNHFVRWEDNTTDVKRIITVTENHNYIAFFEENKQNVPTYIITVLSADESMGTVQGGGAYAEGTVIIIRAIAKDGYEFDRWSDGSKEASRELSVTANAKYVASFKAKKTYYTLNVLSLNEAQGTVTGSGVYEAGTTVTIAAVAAEGYHFKEWNDGNTENPRQVVVDDNITLIAVFEVGAGVDNLNAMRDKARKVMIDGHVYIVLPDGTTFDAQGHQVK